MRRILYLTLVLWLYSSQAGGQVMPQPLSIDSVSCLHTENGQDQLKFPAGHKAFDVLYRRLDTLFLEGRGQVNVLHIGGSHVQAGYFPHRVRTDFATLGHPTVGSIGLLFPFGALGTNAPYGYEVVCTGTWTGERCISREPLCPMGLSGAYALTRDTAATITVDLSFLGTWPATSLRVLGDGEDEGVRPILLCRGDTLEPLPSDGRTGYLFPLLSASWPTPPSACTISFRGIVQDSLGFVLRGLLPEGHTSGLTYTASGINGAAVPSWLRCSLLERELALVAPDLVVFGIGINDANVLPQAFDAEQFKENYRQLMRLIRRVSPQCCFLFVTNNDCWFNVRGRRRQFNTNTVRVQKAMDELARESGGAVFDVFALMGGQGASAAWVAAGLQRPDHIHFTREGYELLGDMLYNALVNDYLDAE